MSRSWFSIIVSCFLILPFGECLRVSGEEGRPSQLSAAIVRDTSFTLTSAFAKIRKDHPEAFPASLRHLPGISRHNGLVYRTVQGRDLHLDLFRMETDTMPRRPVVLMFHGGGWRSGDRSMEYPMAERLAAAGFVAATVEYRLSIEAQYPAALDDGREAIRWMKRHAGEFGGNPEAIAVYGVSSGGHLAALLGVWTSDSTGSDLRLQAIIDVDGPVDLTDPSESGKDQEAARPSAAAMWLGATYAQRPDLWREASPAFRVTRFTPPIIFINSGEPRYRAGRDRMLESMRAFGLFNSVRVVPDSPHTFWLFHPWHEDVARSVIGFLKTIFPQR